MVRKTKTKYHVRQRIFLNRDTEMPAFIIGVVQDTSVISDDSDDWKWGRIELKLGDCARNVAFDFNMDTRADRADSLHKINRIAAVVNAVRDAISKEVEALNQRSRVKLKQKKAKS